MAGRKLLYILRRPLDAGDAETLLPGGKTVSLVDDISVVLLDAAVADTKPFPGRLLVLQENPAVAVSRPNAEAISYADLVKLVFEADSTIVI